MSGFDAREYWESRLRDNYSLGGVGWLSLGESYNKWMYRVRRTLFLTRVAPLVGGRALDVLDVGSGTGFYIECWHDLGIRSVMGADITNVAVESLKKRFPGHEFTRLDIGGGSDQLPAQHFDMISVMDVLYHIVDDTQYRRAFQNLASLLKPGGLLLFTENFVQGNPTKSREHNLHRSRHEIETIVSDVGLVSLSRRPIFVLMNTPLDSRNRAHWLLWNIFWRVVARVPGAGYLFGACLYPIELALASRLSEGPSTEFMVCRKP